MINANPFTDLDEYELRHLVEHLEMAKRLDDLHRVLWLEWVAGEEVSAPRRGIQGWLDHLVRQDQAKREYPCRNDWYEIREERGDIEGYLADVERAWQLTERGIIAEQGNERPLKATGLQCGYALFRASIGRLALNIPSNLLAALVKRKIWTQTQAVVYAELLPEEGCVAKI
jgi:hypothetical protein